jgi:predicted MFS family arabinose efflux permease
MVRLPPHAKKLVLLGLDAVLVPLALWCAFSLRLGVWHADLEGVLLLSSMLVALSLPAFMYFGLYRTVTRHIKDHGLWLMARAAGFSGVVLGVLTFLPVFTKSVFKEGANTYSHLLAFSGAGSVVGALVVAWLGQFKRMGLAVLLVQVVYGLFIVGFAMSRTMWLSNLLLFLTGAALMMVFSTVTSLVQLTAPNEMRGRVMSIYMLAFRGGMPLGSLASGWAATYISAPAVLQINGVLLVAVAIYFLIRSHGVREI